MTKNKPVMRFTCPMPQTDFDTITIGHGSGGKLTRRLLDTMVFPLLNNEWLAGQGDGAVLNLHGRMAVSTDSFVVSPVFFPGGDIGDLAINGTVNDLAMCGAQPDFISLSFILEEGLPVTEFWEILLSIRNACDAAGVRVITGDTKVVERGKGDKIFINTTGIGRVHHGAKLGEAMVRPGDKVIVSGPLARHGIAIMSIRKGLEFETQILSDTRPLHDICRSLLYGYGAGIRMFRDPTRGGVATVLHEIADKARLGIDLDEKQIPVEDEVAGACEMLGLDPLYVANEGLFIAIVDGGLATDILGELHRWEHGSAAAVIGTITESHPGMVILNSAIGGKRVLPLITGEQLPRIC
jgi:hydrogenase expression/formation protein HypE